MAAKPSAQRRPRCSPSQPPSSAPGPAASNVSHRIVAVMRPSSGSGVTACRSARKLMKMSTAPAANVAIMNAKAATPSGPAGVSAAAAHPSPTVA